MKKALLFAVVLGAVSFTSCKKDYTCTWTFGGQTTTTEYEGLSSSEADDVETVCKLSGGTFDSK